MRVVALVMRVLDPIDTLGKQHPWLASFAVGLVLAVLALVVQEPLSALCALVAIPPTARAMLWFAKDWTTTGAPPVLPPPFE